MTNSTHADLRSIYRQTFHELLAAHGITETHGTELLRLMHMVTNTYENVVGAVGGGEKLSAPRWRLLMRLLVEERAGGSYVYPTELSKSQSVSKNTISAHLRALEEQGLIIRELDPEDRRQFRIHLSDAGRTLIQNGTPKFVTYLNKLASDLTGAEVEQLQALLWKLHGSLVHHGGLNEACLRMNQNHQTHSLAEDET
ncbi:MAG: MarR family transcriptional regulator [Chloroflexi bacterium]|nr:MarR family transcriptional regulator [Chloroflexota bacterium]